jgi:hypothetical protein
MGKNVGTIDGTLRIVPLATALIGWCAVYRLIGRNTCALDKRN